MALARGKVILFGEHAVVYGHPALAAGLEAGVDLDAASPAPLLRLRLEPPGLEASAGDGSPLGAALARLAAILEGAGYATGAALTLRSALPAGAGLGSSAALAVAAARALAADAPLELILQAAHAAESVFHGNPSGVDHTTSACGGLLRFQRGATPTFSAVSAPVRLPLVVAQLGPGADTGRMVGGVRALRDAWPHLIDPQLAWMGALAEAGIAAVERGDLAAVGRLMELAQGALVGLGVSTAALDRGCWAAREAGALGAKLTGAGGGGCIVALCAEDGQQEVAAAVEAAGALLTICTFIDARPRP